MAEQQFAQKAYRARILHFGRRFSRVDSDALLGHTVKSNHAGLLSQIHAFVGNLEEVLRLHQYGGLAARPGVGEG